MSSNDTPLLSIRNLSKRFGATVALDAVDLDVRPGEIHALVGHNGSGKSTLIKILAGFHRPDPDGIVEVDRTPLDFGSAASSRRAGLRFVHQDLGLVHTLNAVENLALGVGFQTGRLGRIRWGTERRSARLRMRKLGYDIDVEAPVGALTASERTGVAIARAMHHARYAKVLVVDEPTAMLPRQEAEVLFEAIRRVRQSNVGVIYVSHRLDEVFAIADRVTVLRDGRRVGTFPAGELDERRLVELMTGSETLTARSAVDGSARGHSLLSVTNLCGSVLNDLTFQAHAGEVLGVAGLTGSGRDELLPLLFGAREPLDGTVEVNGSALPPAQTRAAIAAGLALVPSDRHRDGSVGTLTVRENLVLTDLRRHTARMGAQRRERERSEARTWAASLRIRPADPDVPFTSLSGGNQQKVILAKWLRLRPRVLLLDEPTQGVDVHAKAIIHHLAREIANSGTAVIVASSDDEELCECCDRVLVLRDGQFAGELQRDQINPHNLARLQLAAIA